MQIVAHSENAAQEPKEVRQLEVGKSIERELAGGQSHSYQITCGSLTSNPVFGIELLLPRSGF
jgi:hypothetical protein